MLLLPILVISFEYSPSRLNMLSVVADVVKPLLPGVRLFFKRSTAVFTMSSVSRCLLTVSLPLLSDSNVERARYAVRAA